MIDVYATIKHCYTVKVALSNSDFITSAMFKDGCREPEVNILRGCKIPITFSPDLACMSLRETESIENRLLCIKVEHSFEARIECQVCSLLSTVTSSTYSIFIRLILSLTPLMILL